MAEKKQHKIISASTGAELTEAEKKAAAAKTYKKAKPVGNATPMRIGAIVLWVLAIGFEVFAIMELLTGKPALGLMSTLAWAIIALVLDLACVVVGSQLWKKANHIKPASEKNKVLFWLYNNLGVILSIAAFLPFIILILTSKNNDKKTKIIAIAVAAVALIIGGLTSYDFNPVSQEQQAAAMETLGDANVYWAPFGKVYHTTEGCQALNQSDELTIGTVEEAIAANRTRLCKFCATRDEIEGVATDGTASPEEIVETADDSNITVYWAEGAEGCHTNPDCSALDEFEQIVSGTIEQAQAAGHGEICELCK